MRRPASAFFLPPQSIGTAYLLELVAVRRRVGVADDREVAQAEALLKQAKSTVPSLRVALEAQLNRLDILMCAQPGTYAEELSWKKGRDKSCEVEAYARSDRGKVRTKDPRTCSHLSHSQSAWVWINGGRAMSSPVVRRMRLAGAIDRKEQHDESRA